MRIALLTFIITILCSNTFAQNISKDTVVSNNITLTHITLDKKPWRAVAIGNGINLGIFGFNRFVTKENFAYISLNSIKRNFRTVPVWDTDLLSTNFIGHPYQGSLYFVPARANGYSFYESIPFALLGSLVWEFTLENEPPSINDIISTPTGGAAVGEITYRLSDLILDNRSSGGDRFMREFFGAILAPTRFINRLVTGEAWKYTGGRGNYLPTTPLIGKVSVGARHVNDGDNTRKWGLSTIAEVEYGDAYEDDVEKPYEWFDTRIQLNVIASRFSLTELNIIGALRTYELYNKNNWQIYGGLFQHFNFYNSKVTPSNGKNFRPFYISESASLGTGLLVKNNNTKLHLDGRLYINGIALGASISDYLNVDNRDYNMGSGFSLKTHINLDYNNKIKLKLKGENYNIYTWKDYDINIDLGNLTDHEIKFLDTQGENSVARLYLLGLAAEYNISNILYVGIERYRYIRRTTYKHMPNVIYKAWDSFLHLGLRF